jgi:hypothetical protein
MRLDLGPTLAGLKRELQDQVDREAEAARLRFITGGAGQALEYQATEAEARAFLAAAAPALAAYPFLKAEVDARELAEGTAPAPAAVAAEIVAQAEAWTVVGAEIKRLRRAAKLAIDAAASPQAARAAAMVTWPEPG